MVTLYGAPELDSGPHSFRWRNLKCAFNALTLGQNVWHFGHLNLCFCLGLTLAEVPLPSFLKK